MYSTLNSPVLTRNDLLDECTLNSLMMICKKTIHIDQASEQYNNEKEGIYIKQKNRQENSWW